MTLSPPLSLLNSSFLFCSYHAFVAHSHSPAVVISCHREMVNLTIRSINCEPCYLLETLLDIFELTDLDDLDDHVDGDQQISHSANIHERMAATAKGKVTMKKTWN